MRRCAMATWRVEEDEGGDGGCKAEGAIRACMSSQSPHTGRQATCPRVELWVQGDYSRRLLRLKAEGQDSALFCIEMC